MAKITIFETIIYAIGIGSALYIFLQFFIPIIQNLMAQGITGLIVLGIIIWVLFQKINKTF